jgi:hypothetical protein
MFRRSVEETAVLIATLLNRANKKRARISERTLRVLSKRKTLRDAFKQELRDELDDLGIHLVQLNRGGFAAIAISALEGAEAITAKQYMPDILEELKSGNADRALKKLRADVEAVEDDESDE